MDKKKKLLLVDDDPALLETLRDFLDFEGYAVSCASSGEEALVTMRRETYDLVILDMSMPGMGGVGFLERVTDASGNTTVPVLVLTARSMMAEFFADKNVAGFLAKPCAPDDLLAEINRILFENAAEVSMVAPLMRTAVVADGDAIFLQQLQEELRRAGFEVVPASDGAAAVEACVMNHPDILMMRLSQPVMCADEVAGLLGKLPSGKETIMVVYGVDASFAPLDKIAALALPETHVIGGIDLNRIVDRALMLTGGERK